MKVVIRKGDTEAGQAGQGAAGSAPSDPSSPSEPKIMLKKRGAPGPAVVAPPPPASPPPPEPRITLKKRGSQGAADLQCQAEPAASRVTATGSAGKTPVRNGRARTAYGRYGMATSSAGGDNTMAFAVVGIVVVLLVVVLALAAGMSSKKKRRYVQAQAAPVQVQAPVEKPYTPPKFKELGGMTMAEWEKKFNKNNEMRDTRKTMLNEHRQGSKQQ